MSPDELAQIAYAAYGETTDHKNYMGLPMPTWEDLPAGVQQAWMNAAQGVRVRVMRELAPAPQRALVDEKTINNCARCGFMWPPGVEAANRSCPGCQQAYDS